MTDETSNPAHLRPDSSTGLGISSARLGRDRSADAKVDGGGDDPSQPRSSSVSGQLDEVSHPSRLNLRAERESETISMRPTNRHLSFRTPSTERTTAVASSMGGTLGATGTTIGSRVSGDNSATRAEESTMSTTNRWSNPAWLSQRASWRPRTLSAAELPSASTRGATGEARPAAEISNDDSDRPGLSKDSQVTISRLSVSPIVPSRGATVAQPRVTLEQLKNSYAELFGQENSNESVRVNNDPLSDVHTELNRSAVNNAPRTISQGRESFAQNRPALVRGRS